jgi:ABC transporter substrate binding protein (PQQ-dependent alcohol dehydrogenase system)
MALAGFQRPALLVGALTPSNVWPWLSMRREDAEARNPVCRRVALACAVSGACMFLLSPVRADDVVVRIGYVRSTMRHPTISPRDAQARDDGLAGALLAIDDNNTTGRFIGQSFELIDAPVRSKDDLVEALKGLVSRNVSLILTDVAADSLLALADSAAGKTVAIFNLAAPDDSLREQNCRAEIFHIAPTRSMLADALAQYLVWKKWTRWFLLCGSHPDDALLADSYRRAAKRFGARIVGERVVPDTGGARQTDSGVIQMQQQVPVLTQGAPEYDVLVAADENEVFAGYLPYRTWDARPVAGSSGLEPVTWDANSESWGGTQLRNRFERRFSRPMSPLDMQAWTGARMIGEATIRGKSADPARILTELRDPDFGVAAYKGVRLTLRDWNQQMRQPIFLADGRGVVSISPQPGFLHQVTELDTLGMDRPETRCRL